MATTGPTPPPDGGISGEKESLKDVADILKKIKRESEDVKEIARDITKLKKEEVEVESDNFDLSRKTTAELRKQQGVYNRQVNLVHALQRTLKENKKAATDTAKIYAQAETNLTKAQAEKAAKDVEKIKKDKEDLGAKKATLDTAKRAAGITDLEDELANIAKERQILEDAGITAGEDYYGLKVREARLQERINKLIQDRVKNEQAAYDQANNLVKANEAAVAKADESVRVATEARDNAKKANEEAEKNVRISQRKLRVMQGQADTTKKTVDALTDQVKAQNYIDQFLGSHIKYYKQMRTAIVSIRENGWNPLKQSVTAYIAMLEVSLAVLGGFIDRFKEVQAGVQAFREETGLAASQSAEIEKSIRETNVKLSYLGVSMEKASKAAATLQNQFEVAGIATDAMRENTAMLAANLGIAESDTAKIIGTFDSIAKSAGMTSESMLAATAVLAKMGGVAATKVMKDIAEASGETLSFLAKSPMALMRSAVEARRLGTTVNALSKSARGLLNFQESITDELTASALIGRSLNFQAARRAAYEGDVVKSRQLALEQIKKAGDFTKLNVYQQEALARAAGMTVEEVIKQQNQQEMLAALERERPEMYRDYLDMQKKIAENEKAAKGDLVAQGIEYVKNQERQTKLNQLTNSFKSIWTSIYDALEPVVDLFVGFLSLLNKFAKLFAEAPYGLRVFFGLVVGLGAALAAAFSTVMLIRFARGVIDTGKAIKDLSSVVKDGAPALKNLAEGLSDAGKAGKDAAGGAGGIGGLRGFVSGISGKGMLQAAGAILIFAGAMWVLAKAFQEFKDVKFEDIVAGLTSMIVSLGILTGAALLLAPVSEIVVPVLYALGGAVALLGVGALAAGKGMEFFGEGIQKLKDADLFKIAGGVAAIAGAFSLFGIGGILGGIGALFGVGVFVFLERLTAYSVDLERVGNAIDKIRKSYFDLATELGKKVTVNIPTDTIQSLEKMVSGKIQAAVEVLASTAIEVKNLNELKETVQMLVDAIATLGGTAGTASPIVNINNNQLAIVEKLDELVTLFKTGQMKLTVDGSRINKIEAQKSV